MASLRLHTVGGRRLAPVRGPGNPRRWGVSVLAVSRAACGRAAIREAAGLSCRCLGGVHACCAPVLGLAARLLPAASVDGVLVRYADVGTVLFEAVSWLGTGAVAQRRASADEAMDVLAGYLVSAGLALRQPWTSRVVRSWLAGRRLGQVQAAPVAAARSEGCRCGGAACCKVGEAMW